MASNKAMSLPGAPDRVGAPGADATNDQGRRHAESAGRNANGAWEALMAAYATLIKELAGTGIWDGASMREYDVLYTLSKCPVPIRQSELERHVLLSQPAISRLVDRLVDRELVRRSPDPADRRGILLALTEAGRSMQRRIGVRHARDVVRAVTARLNRSEIAELQRLAGKLAEPRS